MARPTLYGIANSRALRSIWAIEETGIDYEHVPTHFRDAGSDAYRAVNPNARIPALVDGDVTLFESMAINLYLARKYGGKLYPADDVDQAYCWQWSVWAISEIEPLQMQIVIQKLFTPEDKRDADAIRRATRALERPLAVLDNELGKRNWLVAGRFTVADLNVAAVMHLMKMVQVDVSGHTHVAAWLDRCYARPALARAQAVDG